jgi:protein SCO1/2
LRYACAGLLIAGCASSSPYILEGTVVEVRSPTEVVVDHAPIAGLMDAMVMPVTLAPALAGTLAAGDRIVARVVQADGGLRIEKVRQTGYAPVDVPDAAGGPLRAGETAPQVAVPVTGGGMWSLVGEAPTLVSFVYTRCPLPEFCPATVARLAAVQRRLPTGTRLLSITLDPAYDSLDVLGAYAATVGADPTLWRFGRLDADALATLAGAAALGVYPGANASSIEHNTRHLVLDASGRLIERYDDNRFPVDRVVSQLTTGRPPAPEGSDGTITPVAAP